MPFEKRRNIDNYFYYITATTSSSQYLTRAVRRYSKSCKVFNCCGQFSHLFPASDIRGIFMTFSNDLFFTLSVQSKGVNFGTIKMMYHFSSRKYPKNCGILKRPLSLSFTCKEVLDYFHLFAYIEIEQWKR